MATPNLALIPSAYKARVVYSVLPNTGAGDFTFVRSGNATRINKDGLIETVDSHVPRLNYDIYQGKPKQCPSLLLEPSRENLVTQSENFESGWSLDDATVVSNSAISPDGTLTATLFKGNTNSSKHTILLNPSISASVPASLSLFVKAKELKYIQIASVVTSGQYVNFDVSKGIVGTVGGNFTNAKIEPLGNGWYRCSASATVYNNMYISLVSGLNSGWLESWAMPNSTDGLYIWGAMLEEGSFVSSYIPTNGSTETRNAEQCNSAGNSDTFNDSEGVLMVEISALAADSTNKVITISDGSTSNRVQIYFNSSNNIQASVTSGGSGQVAVTSDNNIKLYNKVSFKYKVNDFELWVNGYKVAVDTLGAVPTGLQEIDFDNGAGGADFYGKTKQLQYFDSELTDSQLEYLTSYRSFGDMVESQNYIIQ